VLAGCGREASRVYRVPKQREQPAVAAASPHSAAHGSPSQPGRPHVHWQLPKGWDELPPGEIRLGDFRVRGTNGALAEVTIVPLPGHAGRDVDNVNRCRGQVGLAPVNEEQLAAETEPVEIANQSSRLYDLAGVSAEGEKNRILAAILRRGETSWFFKAIGDDALVQREKSTFKEFLKTVSFDGGADSQPVAANATEATASNNKPNWKVPSGWNEQPPGQMQTAKFTLAGNAEVAVSAFPGDVGGTLANVNRWRAQLGRAPVDAAELPKHITSMDMGGIAATLVDITAENKQRRLIAVIAPLEGQTWFFKLLGEEPSVAGAKDAFIQFVKSAH
jgi:hypothetical protein